VNLFLPNLYNSRNVSRIIRQLHWQPFPTTQRQHGSNSHSALILLEHPQFAVVGQLLPPLEPLVQETVLSRLKLKIKIIFFTLWIYNLRFLTVKLLYRNH
jgi:hypothetical protein